MYKVGQRASTEGQPNRGEKGIKEGEKSPFRSKMELAVSRKMVVTGNRISDLELRFGTVVGNAEGQIADRKVMGVKDRRKQRLHEAQ